MKISVASPLSSVLLLFALAVDKAEAQVCGDPGRARFNEGGDRPQGYEGELFSATHCYVEGTYCKSPTLPLEARGSKETIMAYYGNSISSWCTTPVTDFSYAFFQLPVSRTPRHFPESFIISIHTPFVASRLSMNQSAGESIAPGMFSTCFTTQAPSTRISQVCDDNFLFHFLLHHNRTV